MVNEGAGAGKRPDSTHERDRYADVKFLLPAHLRYTSVLQTLVYRAIGVRFYPPDTSQHYHDLDLQTFAFPPP